jgi:hypothetical protein
MAYPTPTPATGGAPLDPARLPVLRSHYLRSLVILRFVHSTFYHQQDPWLPSPVQ